MITDIPNFCEVCPGIFRGGQPVTEDDWDFLESIGIVCILKLNSESEGSDQPARERGMDVIDLPLSLKDQFLGPTDEEINDALATITTEGTFIHCEHGQDRTGLIIAIYRVRAQGWTKAAARTEMLAHGFHETELGLDWYWREKVAEPPAGTKP